jgi:hypothetical protein
MANIEQFLEKHADGRARQHVRRSRRHPSDQRATAMISSSVLLLCVSACSTAPAIPGVVVDAPQVKPPPPELVQRTSARPVGYFRKLVLDALLMP